MKYQDNLMAIAPSIQWFGLIFYQRSKRYINGYLLQGTNQLKRVGVFVNASKEYVRKMAAEYALDIVQLHGEESLEYCQQFYGGPLKIMKAISVKDKTDISNAKNFEGVVDYIIFDTKGAAKGGNGYTFDWDLLQEYHGRIPFMLSGGISIEHAEQLRNIKHPLLMGVDINSRFELEPGLKNSVLVQNFANELFR